MPHCRNMRETVVVAPDRDRSGASNSLTLEQPIRARTVDNGFVRVEGTPTDCVHLAITGLLEDEPDMVVSGINAGANMGDDVLYSGTVAAATEGRFLGFPAIAVSMASYTPRHFAYRRPGRGRVGAENSTTRRLMPTRFSTSMSPICPTTSLQGLLATRLGHRHKAEPVVKSQDPRGRPIYWVGPAGAEAGCRSRHRLSRGAQRLRFSSHPAAGRPDTPLGASRIAGLAQGHRGMTQPRLGIGMTSQRTRERLVQRLREEGIRDHRVLDSIRNTPRHLFVDEALASRAYEDTALPIGNAQTISQPYIVARMTEVLLAGGPLENVLEVGTGSGYQTAVLAPLVRRVYTVEAHPGAARPGASTVSETGDPQHCHQTRRRWPGSAGIRPLRWHHRDGCTRGRIPKHWSNNCKPGGRMVLPVGLEGQQVLVAVTRTEDGFEHEMLERVSFVPLLSGVI
jgi:5'/3'-nucleotidase SurE/protein-L-isoaspartate(D-aspartate) O-methyltransferase